MLRTEDRAAVDTPPVAGRAAADAAQGQTPGAFCRNCDTPLEGRWCHACGQKADGYHRSMRHLIAEAFEGLTHFDGRFWTTVRRLLFRPGQVTQDYLQGKRASQIPPFRLFLVVLLIVFFSGGVGTADQKFSLGFIDPAAQPHMTAEQRARIEAGLPEALNSPWLRKHTLHAFENQGAFFGAMAHWSHHFAILMLPLATLLLSALFAFRREVYAFDHMIFAMHSLSFQGLLLSLAFLLGTVASVAWLLLAVAPVHLFFHMRGAYGTSSLGTLARMAVLFAGTVIGFGLLMAGLVFVGMATAH